MIQVAAICLVLLILPFTLAYIHIGAKQNIQSTVGYYRYFAFFNVILAALFVASRMFLVGPKAAAISGWAYSPIFHLYGIALLSIALMAAVTLFNNSKLMLAPSICWVFFLVMSSISHLLQVHAHEIKDVKIILVHVVYNLIVSGVLCRYVLKLNRHFRPSA